MKTKTLVAVALLAGVATVLRLPWLQVPVVFMAPPFLRLDISDLPVALGGFLYGPWAVVGIAYVKNFIALFATETNGVGELANFIYAVSLAVPAAVIYRTRKTVRSAITGLVLGIVTLIATAMIVNYFIMLPFYGLLYGMSLDAVVAMFSRVNPLIKNRWDAILYCFAPFNLMKGALTAGVMMAAYPLVPLLRKNYVDK
jgi:riboflavin transporter FmnP